MAVETFETLKLAEVLAEVAVEIKKILKEVEIVQM